MVKFISICSILFTSATVVFGVCEQACWTIREYAVDGRCYYTCKWKYGIGPLKHRKRFMDELQQKGHECRREITNDEDVQYLSCDKSSSFGECTSHEFLTGFACGEETFDGAAG